MLPPLAVVTYLDVGDPASPLVTSVSCNLSPGFPTRLASSPFTESYGSIHKYANHQQTWRTSLLYETLRRRVLLFPAGKRERERGVTFPAGEPTYGARYEREGLHRTRRSSPKNPQRVVLAWVCRIPRRGGYYAAERVTRKGTGKLQTSNHTNEINESLFAT